MMQTGWFHPTANLHNIAPECAPLDYITGTDQQIATQTLAWLMNLMSINPIDISHHFW
jgi:3-oxoacyl-(acyl-carrier-protein) synthase